MTVLLMSFHDEEVMYVQYLVNRLVIIMLHYNFAFSFINILNWNLFLDF